MFDSNYIGSITKIESSVKEYNGGMFLHQPFGEPMSEPIRKHCSQPWLDLIASGKKTVEGRRGADSSWLNRVVIWHDGDAEVSTIITRATFYSTLENYVRMEREYAAPHLPLTEDVIAAYERIPGYSSKEIAETGIWALGLRLI